MAKATITGWGMYVPPAVLSNADLETVMDTSDEWITTRTGIKERHISHLDTSQMGAIAGRRALAAAGLEPTDIDLIVVATCTPDRLLPSAAAVVQSRIGAPQAGAFDVNAACAGFVYGLSVGAAMIQAGSFRKVLLVGSERLSPWLDFRYRDTAVLFGDGAGAVVLEASDAGDGVLSVNLSADGTLGDILTVAGSGSAIADDSDGSQYVSMDGREVFRRAVVLMGEAAERSIKDAGLTLDDVDLLIPHQANSRIIDATARRMELQSSQVFVNIESYGNTSAASIPIALCEALEMGRVRPGDTIVFTALGGGLSWGAATLKWGERVAPLGTADIDAPTTSATGLELLQAHSGGPAS